MTLYKLPFLYLIDFPTFTVIHKILKCLIPTQMPPLSPTATGLLSDLPKKAEALDTEKSDGGLLATVWAQQQQPPADDESSCYSADIHSYTDMHSSSAVSIMDGFMIKHGTY